MELRHLRYFVAVAETGSLTEAAEKRLFTSQPSLSRQIRDLEEEVGVALLSRGVRGVELTHAGKAFFDHVKMVLAQVDASVEAARRAAQPAKPRLVIGFLTGLEMTWLPEAMQILQGELPNVEVTIVSDYSPDLGEALVRGKLDLAFMRAEPGFQLRYKTVHQERFIVLMPSDHPLTVHDTIEAQQLVGEPFIAMDNKARVLRAIIDTYLKSQDVHIKPAQGVDNPAMVMSLVSSTRGVAIIPEYAKNLLPWSVVSRPLQGEQPSVDLVIGYSEANASPVLKHFLSRVDEMIERVAKRRVVE